MNKRSVAAVLGAAIALPVSMARANLTGFSGFAPINETNSDAGAVSTDVGVGYMNSGSNFILTDNLGQEATSGFASTAQNISGSWTASFTYQETLQAYNSSSLVAADGFAFVLQNDSRGTAALGGDGGSYGYGAPGSSNANVAVSTITPSAAIAVNNFGGFLSYGGAVGFNTNGATSTGNGLSTVSISHGATNASPTADAINVTYTYSAATGQLKEKFVDASSGYGNSTKSTYVHVDTGVNLASTLGSNTALVGFSGGTGGYTSAQNISNFSFATGGSNYTAVSANSVFSPIPLTTGSFNQAMVVPASASGLASNTSNPVASYVTATMDDGPSFTASSSGDTWFEKGFVAGGGSTPSNTSAGMPTSGSTFASDSRHSFTMPTYGLGVNDAVLLDDGDRGDGTVDTSDTITFATPHAYSALSFLTATGNGPGYFTVTVNYVNGTTVLLSGDQVSPDWFGSGTLAYATGGRYEIDNNTYDLHSGGQPDLWQVDVGLTDSSDPISSLTLAYDGGDRSEVAIFAVSGAVPEPASLSLVGLAGLGLLRRRRAR